MKQNASIDVPAEQLGWETADMVRQIGYGSLAPALQESVELAQKSIGVNFADAAAPHGGAWAPRKKPHGGLVYNSGPKAGQPFEHPLLILSGKLFQGATSDFGEGHVGEVRDRDAMTGVDPGEVPYAASQNFGDPDRNLPQREFEDVDDATLDAMTELVADEAIDLLL